MSKLVITELGLSILKEINSEISRAEASERKERRKKTETGSKKHSSFAHFDENGLHSKESPTAKDTIQEFFNERQERRTSNFGSLTSTDWGKMRNLSRETRNTQRKVTSRVGSDQMDQTWLNWNFERTSNKSTFGLGSRPNSIFEMTKGSGAFRLTAPRFSERREKEKSQNESYMDRTFSKMKEKSEVLFESKKERFLERQAMAKKSQEQLYQKVHRRLQGIQENKGLAGLLRLETMEKFHKDRIQINEIVQQFKDERKRYVERLSRFHNSKYKDGIWKNISVDKHKQSKFRIKTGSSPDPRTHEPFKNKEIVSFQEPPPLIEASPAKESGETATKKPLPAFNPVKRQSILNIFGIKK